MGLINCKVELKLKWTKFCVLYAAGADNVNGNVNDNINNFTIKDTKLYVPAKTLSEDLKDQFIGVSIKQKEMIKIRQMNLDIFSN